MYINKDSELFCRTKARVTEGNCFSGKKNAKMDTMRSNKLIKLRSKDTKVGEITGLSLYF